MAKNHPKKKTIYSLTLTILLTLVVFNSVNIIEEARADPPITECNDGVDNDGDGLVDWQYDCGCYGPDDTTENALSREEENGWTTFDPSPDTRIVLVTNNPGQEETDVNNSYPGEY